MWWNIGKNILKRVHKFLGFSLYKFNKHYLLEKFYVHSEISRELLRFPMYSCTHMYNLPTMNICTTPVHLYYMWIYIDTSLSLLNIYGHIMIITSQFILGFILCVVHSIYNEYIKTYIHGRIIQNSFTVQNIFCILPIYPSLSPSTPHNHWSFCHIQRFAFSRMSYSWNNT